jgi:hypothetical protein
LENVSDFSLLNSSSLALTIYQNLLDQSPPLRPLLGRDLFLYSLSFRARIDKRPPETSGLDWNCDLNRFADSSPLWHYQWRRSACLELWSSDS